MKAWIWAGLGGMLASNPMRKTQPPHASPGLIGAVLLVLSVLTAPARSQSPAGSPWSPRDVEYHDGMTICPGQRAHGPVVTALEELEVAEVLAQHALDGLAQEPLAVEDGQTHADDGRPVLCHRCSRAQRSIRPARSAPAPAWTRTRSAFMPASRATP